MTVGAHDLEAHIDTGADHTVLSLELASTLGFDFESAQKVEVYNAEADLRGMVGYIWPEFPFKLGEDEFSCRAVVAPIVDHLLLGSNFFIKYKANICYEDKTVRIGELSFPLRLDKRTQRAQITFPVKVAKRVKVAPNTTQAVKVKICSTPEQVRFATMSVMSPTQRGPDVMIPNAVLPISGEAWITVKNVGDRPFRLGQGSTVGQAQVGHYMPIQLNLAPISDGPPVRVRRLARGDPEGLPVFDAPETGGVFPPDTSGEFEDLRPNDPYYVDMDEIKAARTKDKPDQDVINLAQEVQYVVTDADTVLDLAKELPRHLHVTFVRGCEHLNSNQAKDFAQILYLFQDVFSRHAQDLGCFKGLQHKIDTGEAKPVTTGIRRTPLGLEKEEEDQIRKMENMGVIESSASDWSSAPVMVKKKDGSIRYCIDYRKLNDVTVKDQFPLPLITQCLDQLAGTSFFSALDLSWGYWQIELAPEDRHKTAFITKHGLYQHTRMPFGLCNAPSTFMRAMTLVLKGMTWEEVLAYLDDVIVTGKGFEGHLTNLRRVLERLRWHNLKLKPSKCEFFRTEVAYLGRIVGRTGVTVDPAKIETVATWPVPKSSHDIQVFMGLVGYHREFMKDLAKIAEPLYARMTPKVKFEWTDECQQAFEELREVLKDAPVLAYPNPEEPFILDVDASNTAIGAELLQVVDGKERVVSYASYRLTPQQRNYCTTRRELLAVVRFTNHFKHYLLGRPFDVRTDHSSLVWLTRFKYPEGQLARWLEELSQYNMRLMHRKGQKHGNADALSRRPGEEPFCRYFKGDVQLTALPCGGCKYCERCHREWKRFEDEVDDVAPMIIRALHSNWYPQYSPEEMRKRQKDDKILGQVIEWLEEDSPSALEVSLAHPHVRRYWSDRHKLLFEKGVLFIKRDQDGSLPPRSLLLIPESMKIQILEDSHDHMCAGHMGRDRTLERCRRRFFWWGQSREVAKYIAACRICLLAKKAARPPKAAQVAYQAGLPMERVQLDILGPFKPKTRRGNTHILMMIDQFTRWFECAPLPDTSAETIASVAIEQFFCRFGFPAELHTDQGKNVDGNVIAAMCEKLGIKKTRTTPYHPASNGEIERQNRTLLCLIRAYAHDKPDDWDKYLPYLAGAMRSAVNRSTGETANRMMLGREVTTPSHISLGMVTPGSSAPTQAEEYAEHLEKTLAEVHEHVRLKLKMTS